MIGPRSGNRFRADQNWSCFLATSEALFLKLRAVFCFQTTKLTKIYQFTALVTFSHRVLPLDLTSRASTYDYEFFVLAGKVQTCQWRHAKNRPKELLCLGWSGDLTQSLHTEGQQSIDWQDSKTLKATNRFL